MYKNKNESGFYCDRAKCEKRYHRSVTGKKRKSLVECKNKVGENSKSIVEFCTKWKRMSLGHIWCEDGGLYCFQVIYFHLKPHSGWHSILSNPVSTSAVSPSFYLTSNFIFLNSIFPAFAPAIYQPHFLIWKKGLQCNINSQRQAKL